MGFSEDIETDVKTTVTTKWNKRNGQKIPSSDDVTLAGGAVEIEATFLYADLANSSKMVKELDRRIAAKIIKSFLSVVSKLIKHNDGKIISFDGDRVLGVFYGNSKNTKATKCGLQIKWAVNEVIRKRFESSYTAVKNATFTIDHGVGIDTGTVLAVRGGVRGDNDLIWIGRAPNLAAKLSDLRESPYQTIITASVYNMLSDSSKYGGEANTNMWKSRSWSFLDENITVYRSSWQWKP